MPGSKSSAPDADSARDLAGPLSFTVHNMAAPNLADGRRRTATGRLKMILVFAVCAAPVIASYLTYFVIRPEGRTNHGALITPTRSLPPALELRGRDGMPVTAASLRGQWLLITVGPSTCDAACEKRLFMQRQLREMLGRERVRLDKIWLVTDTADPAPALRDPLKAALVCLQKGFGETDQPIEAGVFDPSASGFETAAPQPIRDLIVRSSAAHPRFKSAFWLAFWPAGQPEHAWFYAYHV